MDATVARAEVLGASNERGPSGPKLLATNVSKQFVNKNSDEAIPVLENVSVAVQTGEFMTIVGPSGCGKTTLIRIFAGLLPASDGQVLLDGVPVKGPASRIGFVFQSDNLMPWRTVWDNIGLGPELRGEHRSGYGPRIEHLLDLVGLSGFAGYYPHQLSGGMRQRVNLARALAIQPDVLLMDEPFAALDAQTREIMQDELLRIWRETGNTIVFITHQIDEAILLADRLMIMAARPGRVQEMIDVGLERPRNLAMKRSQRFTELADYVWHSIEQQVRASIRKEQLASPPRQSRSVIDLAQE